MPAKMVAQSDAWEIARKKAAQMRYQLTDHQGMNSSKDRVIMPRSEQSTIVSRFRTLRQKISLGEPSIRDFIEEGRRF